MKKLFVSGYKYEKKVINNRKYNNIYINYLIIRQLFEKRARQTETKDVY